MFSFLFSFNLIIISGIDERDPQAVRDVENWLASTETKNKLENIVNSVSRHKKIYVASETALVRRHVADMIRAKGCEADYFMLSGTTHPYSKEEKQKQLEQNVRPFFIFYFCCCCFRAIF